MRWLSNSWIWLIVVGGMLWMHLGMHRGHGGHGGSRRADHDASSAPEAERSPAGPSGHGGHDRHGSEPATARSHRHRGC